MPAQPPQKPRYRKVALKNVRLWEPCEPSAATDWIASPCLDGGEPSYPIQPINLSDHFAPHLYVIVAPDGSLWQEGSLYLFEAVTEQGMGQAAASNTAGDLADFMNRTDDSGLDFLNFDGPESLRPTYRYRGSLKTEIINGRHTRGYCNRKIYSMQSMYRWLVNSRNFKPKQPMWKSTTRHIRYTDRHGNTQVKEVVSTDLTFKTKTGSSGGDYIVDGAKLKPISRADQHLLMNALFKLSNPEMLLSHIVGITTGMRVQSNLTLRHGSIKKGVGGPEDPYKYVLYGIEIGGEGNPVEAKNSKLQAVLMPAWVHHMLHVYISSERHAERAAKSPIKEEHKQYIFLTRTGRPYYIAQSDEKLFDYSTEKGSALRHFCRKVEAIVRTNNESFKYQLHDLRATFGVNLIEDNTEKLETGKMNQIELLDLVKNRLNHEDITVTMNYLNYARDHQRLVNAQSGFEEHLEHLVRTEMTKHEQLRQKRPPFESGRTDE